MEEISNPQDPVDRDKTKTVRRTLVAISKTGVVEISNPQDQVDKGAISKTDNKSKAAAVSSQIVLRKIREAIKEIILTASNKARVITETGQIVVAASKSRIRILVITAEIKITKF